MVPFRSVENWWHSSCDVKPGSASEINTGVLQLMDGVAPMGLHLFFRAVYPYCSKADGISFEVSLSLNCTDLYKREGGA